MYYIKGVSLKRRGDVKLVSLLITYDIYILWRVGHIFGLNSQNIFLLTKLMENVIEYQNGYRRSVNGHLQVSLPLNTSQSALIRWFCLPNAVYDLKNSLIISHQVISRNRWYRYDSTRSCNNFSKLTIDLISLGTA